MARQSPRPDLSGADPLGVLAAAAAAAPTDFAAWYGLGVALVDAFGASNQPDDLRRGRDALTRAVELDPDSAPAHAALAYAADLGIDTDAALAHARRASALDPANAALEAFAIGRLIDAEAEGEALREIEAAAVRLGVDLADLRRRLAEARMPTDARTLLSNGFVSGRGFVRSWLAAEAERARDAAVPGRKRRRARAERADCARLQREPAERFDAARVPEALRALVGWATRLGVGDDPCRARLLAGLSRAERRSLARAVEPHAAAIHDWLDGFPEGALTAEAAAFLYLLSGLEEIDLDPPPSRTQAPRP